MSETVQVAEEPQIVIATQTDGNIVALMFLVGRKLRQIFADSHKSLATQIEAVAISEFGLLQDHARNYTARMLDVHAEASTVVSRMGADLDATTAGIAERERTIAEREQTIASLNDRLSSVLGEHDAVAAERDDAKRQLASANDELAKVKGQLDDARKSAEVPAPAAKNKKTSPPPDEC